MVQVRFFIDEIFRLLMDVWVLQFFIVSGQFIWRYQIFCCFALLILRKNFYYALGSKVLQKPDVLYVTDVCESDDGHLSAKTMHFPLRVAALCGQDGPSILTLTSSNGGRETLRRVCPSLSTSTRAPSPLPGNINIIIIVDQFIPSTSSPSS